MTRSVRTIVDELLELDPSLKEHEDALIPLVEALLKADPGREPDARFLSELRSQLQQRAAVLSTSSTRPSSFFSMTQLFPFLAGLTAAAVIAVPATSYYLNSDNVPADRGEPLFAFQVTPSSPESFGELSTVAVDGAGMGGARTQSGGGGGGIPAPAADMAVTNTAMPVEPYGMVDEKMIAPGEWTVYEYSHEGEIPTLPQGTVDVLKREKRFLNAPLSLIADRFDLGTVDLDNFSTAKLEYANFIQDKDFGYTVNLDMRNASIGIGMNWEKWPQPNCETEACWMAQRVKIEQVPADADLLALAADFVSDYGIDISHYGAPFVDKTWKRDYDAAPNKADAYVPEVIRVIYPLMIDGKEVHEQYGEKSGISIGVHVKHKRVAEAWGLSDQTYVSSAYDAVSGEEDVRGYLQTFEQPFLDPVMMRNGDIKTKTVKVALGAPTISYGRFYKYEANAQDELLVPSLVFPVTGTNDGSPVYRQFVIVPLAAEMLKQQNGMPMPLIMEDAAE